MTSNFNTSSFDPAARGDLTGTLRYILTKWLQNTDDMLPAKVIAFDRTTNRVSVQPLISVVTTGNEIVQRAVLSSIPVFQMGGGGFVISFPLKTDDLGWIKANDRDISLFLKTVGQNAAASSQPNTARKHDFSDALFIPDTMFQNVTIASDDADNSVWQTIDGSVRMSLSSTGFGINGASDVNAVFDTHSTTKASIPWPRMTISQRDAIPSPHSGMAVWVKDTGLDYLSTYSELTNSWS